jgi:hypothetical protein
MPTASDLTRESFATTTQAQGELVIHRRYISQEIMKKESRRQPQQTEQSKQR